MTICAEMPLAAAKDGLLPRAVRTAVRAAACPRSASSPRRCWRSVFTVLSYLGAPGYTVFNTLVFMSGITAAIPYAFSALAQIKWRVQDDREMHTPRVARDVTVAVVAIVFSVLFVWYSRNTGEDAAWKVWLPFIFGGVAFLLGIPVYLAQRTHMTEPRAGPALPHLVPRKVSRHVLPRRFRGRAAPPGDRPPARPRADPAHPGQRRRPAVRRRHVGRSAPARSTTPSSQKLRDKGVKVHLLRASCSPRRWTSPEPASSSRTS